MWVDSHIFLSLHTSSRSSAEHLVDPELIQTYFLQLSPPPSTFISTTSVSGKSGLGKAETLKGNQKWVTALVIAPVRPRAQRRIRGRGNIPSPLAIITGAPITQIFALTLVRSARSREPTDLDLQALGRPRLCRRKHSQRSPTTTQIEGRSPVGPAY